MDLATITDHAVYRTNDMAMVTYLKLCGHAVQQVYWESDTCYWSFLVSETLVSEVDKFLSSQARVEPREFNRVFNTTKREFYDTNPKNVPPATRR
jgi:hypothetical protein